MAPCSFFFIFSCTQSTLQESEQQEKHNGKTLAACIQPWLEFLTSTERNTPDVSSSFISISNSAVMWDTCLVGDLRPRLRFFDESHLRLTKVTWQSLVQGNWAPSKPRRRASRMNRARRTV